MCATKLSKNRNEHLGSLHQLSIPFSFDAWWVCNVKCRTGPTAKTNHLQMASHFPEKKKTNSLCYRTICGISWIYSYFNRHSVSPAISHTHSIRILWFVTWHLLLSQFTFMEFKCVFDFNGIASKQPMLMLEVPLELYT